MSNKSNSFRPLISSVLSFEQSPKYVPFKYCFSLQEISQIKKYLPKTFKLNGVDSKKPFTKEELQIISKSKFKVRSVNEEILQNQSENSTKTVGFLQRDKIGALQWYKTISLTIPYNSKSQQQQSNAKFIDMFAYYLQNYLHFQNNLTGDLINLQLKSDTKQKQGVTLQGMKDIDLMIMAWSVPAQANDDKIKIISLNLPIVVLLEENVKYNLLQLRQLVINQCNNSFQTLMKHNLNTKVLINGKQQKKFIWLNSYCKEEKALDEQQKLLNIIGQERLQNPVGNPQQNKKEYKFLVIVLFALVCFYLLLKIYPINPRQPTLMHYQEPVKQNQQEKQEQENIF